MNVEAIDSTGVSALEINIDIKRADGSSMRWEKKGRLKKTEGR